ncbi:MAG: hypothetical protein PUP46_02835 [Endozoicomonas sp. (ex Botrylloides leachii)]|nr:hypothetical protein [Endozoicomonas sp. (ex Botrylloides leachii)]
MIVKHYLRCAIKVFREEALKLALCQYQRLKGVICPEGPRRENQVFSGCYFARNKGLIRGQNE